MSTDASAVRNSSFTSFGREVPRSTWTFPNKGAYPSSFYKFLTLAELDSLSDRAHSFDVPEDRIPPVGHQYESIRQLLLLPLTWTDFVKQIRAEHALPPELAGTHDVVQFGEIRIDFL